MTNAEPSRSGLPRFVLRGYDTLPSTNDEARRLAEAGAPHGTVVHAAVQTAGRGRQGRDWHSAKGNLYASFLLRPGIPAQRAGEVGFVAAVTVADVAADLLPGRMIALKWPNDVLVRGAKLCGILAEWLPDDAIVVGIGINVGHAPNGLPYPATFLAGEGCGLGVPAVLSALAAQMAAGVEAWRTAGFAPVRAAWIARGPVLGTPLRLRLGTTEVAGAYAGLDSDGALLLQTEAGLRRIVTGDVATVPASAALPEWPP